MHWSQTQRVNHLALRSSLWSSIFKQIIDSSSKTQVSSFLRISSLFLFSFSFYPIPFSSFSSTASFPGFPGPFKVVLIPLSLFLSVCGRRLIPCSSKADRSRLRYVRAQDQSELICIVIRSRGGIMKFPACSLEGYPPVCAVIYFPCQEPGQPGLVLPHGPRERQCSSRPDLRRKVYQGWA